MNKRWTFPPPQNLNPALVALAGPSAAQILQARGITTVHEAKIFLNPDLYTPTPAAELPEMAAAVTRLLQARASGEPTLVWGDFDTDGVTSTALLVKALQHAGLQVGFTIPLRLGEGHGLNETRLQKYREEGYTLVITVDCGVGNLREAELMKTWGMDLIVTDHHTLPAVLPPAYAVLNPLRLSESHPLRFLTGVGVAYKLAEALWEKLDLGDPEELLDLVALGLIADVGILQRENRYLVQRGLKVLTETKRVGLVQLMNAVMAPMGQSQITERDVGFTIAPKLNAVGRLEDARIAVELLTTDDPVLAASLSQRFVSLNEERRKLTEVVTAQAIALAEAEDLETHRALVLAQVGWPKGVIGLAAGRLASRYDCPVLLITVDEETGVGHGSGRSIPGVNMVEALDSVAPLLRGYGGHPMAAGLQVIPENLPSLITTLRQALAERAPVGDGMKVIPMDLVVQADQPDLGRVLGHLFAELEPLAPFGYGNPLPMIALVGMDKRHGLLRPFGKQSKHLSVQLGDATLYWWNAGERYMQFKNEQRLDLSFRLEPANWRGAVWRGIIEDARPSKPLSVVPLRHRVNLEVEDRRQETDILLEGFVYRGVIPDKPSEVLSLAVWPISVADLKDLLVAAQPKHLFLAGKALDWGQSREWVTAFIKLWQQGERNLGTLSTSGIPQSLISKVILPERQPQEVFALLLQILQETSQFHFWLDQAPLYSIRNLCQRLQDS